MTVDESMMIFTRIKKDPKNLTKSLLKMTHYVKLND